MVICCKYDDCGHQEELEAKQIPAECPRCYGHWIDEDEDYTLLQQNARLLIGCSLVFSKTQTEQIFSIDKGQRTCGRTDFDFVGERKSYISGTHFQFYINNNQLFVEDLNSTNGTFIGLQDKKPVFGKTALQDGGWLVLGQEEFLVKYLYQSIVGLEEETPACVIPEKNRCVECGEELSETIPCVCELCSTWNE